MKHPLFLICAFCASYSLSSLAEPSTSAVESVAKPVESPLVAKPAAPQPWSVVGIWDCEQRDWSGTLTLKDDGSLLGPNEGLSGRWKLEGQGGQIRLVLYWNEWPAEIVTMVGADEFHGDPARGELRMRRQRSATAETGESTTERLVRSMRARRQRSTPAGATEIPPHTELGSIETRTWRQEEPPLKLIRQDEGFCVLMSVTGHFQGSGESVRVYVGEDGYWYLGGSSYQEGVAATCLVIRYRKPPVRNITAW